MASGLYDFGRNQFAMGAIHWKTSAGDTFKCILVDTADYTVDLATHDYYDHVGTASRVGSAQTLTIGADPVAGVCDADDATFTAVTGDSVEAVVIWKDPGGGDSACPLIAWIEFNSVTPNSGDITIQWDSGANKIFKL